MTPFFAEIDQPHTWSGAPGDAYELRRNSDHAVVAILQVKGPARAVASTSDESWNFDGKGNRAAAEVMVWRGADDPPLGFCVVSGWVGFRRPRATLVLPDKSQLLLSTNGWNTACVWKEVSGTELVRTQFLWRFFKAVRARVNVTVAGTAVRELPMIVPLAWFLFLNYLEDDDGA